MSDNLVPESDLPDSISTPAAPATNVVPEHDMPEGMSASASSNEVPEHDLPGAIDPKYETMGQQVLAGVEGVGKGVLGPIATGLELGAHHMGLDEKLGIDTSAEAQKGREEAHPWTHGIGETVGLGTSLATGIGEAGLLAKGVGKLVPESLPLLGKIGSGALKGFIENGAIQGGDEISKAMLGQGNPEEPVSSALAHMGAAGLFGGLGGAAGKGATMALQAAEDAKLGAKASSFLMGFGDAAHTEKFTGGADPIGKFKAGVEKAKEIKKLGIPDIDSNSYRSGMEAHRVVTDALKGKVIGKAIGATGAAVGTAVGGPLGAPAGAATAEAIRPYIEKLIDKTVNKSNKYVKSAVMKVLSSGNTGGLSDVINYATKVTKGQNSMVHHVESLFNAAGNQGIDSYVSDEEREKLKDCIENGGPMKELQEGDVQGFAEGGHVASKSEGVADHLPAQNILLSTAKGRVYNYLNSIRPTPTMRLPFDSEMKDTRHKKSYDKALNIAQKPLSVVNEIHKGTLSPEHVKHLVSMYPEVYNSLNKQINEKIAEQQMSGKKPSYKIRQGLSLLMGSPLDSSFTPASILAAQPKPVQNQPPQGGGMKGGKATTSSMVKQTKTYSTPTQAGESDRASRD